MLHKKKGCKGINKAKGYEGCGLEHFKRKYGLCPSCFYDWMQTTELGKIYYQKQFIPQVRKNTDRQVKKENKELRESNKSISKLIGEAKKPFQKFVRFRDANLPCISCGTIKAEIWDGGHFYKAELYTGLIFNEDNVHKQCRKCNTFLGGNENNYRLGLIKRFGINFVKALDQLAITSRVYKFTKDELREIKAKYQKKLLTKNLF